MRLRVGGLDHRHAHQVAHRHDPDEFGRGAAAVDHGDVPVSALRQARERGARLHPGSDGVGIGRHPFRDLGGRRVGAGRRQADHVALGQDPDGAVVVIDDDDGADSVLAHTLRDQRDRLRRLRGDDRMTHQIADRPFRRHGPKYYDGGAAFP